MSILPAQATCGGCLLELNARMVVGDLRISYDPARYLLYQLENWYMEYFAPDGQPIYACPRCHRLLSYVIIPSEQPYDST